MMGQLTGQLTGQLRVQLKDQLRGQFGDQFGDLLAVKSTIAIIVVTIIGASVSEPHTCQTASPAI